MRRPPSIMYAISGLIAGLVALLGAGLLADFLTAGCVSRSTACGHGAATIAVIAVIAPLTGGIVSALRSDSIALLLGMCAGCAMVALEFVVLIGLG